MHRPGMPPPRLLRATLAVAIALPLMGSDHDAAFTTVKPIIEEFCLTCHSTKKQKGDFDLEFHTGPNGVRNHPKVWQQVLGQLNDHEMPPKDKPQPSAMQREHLLAWVRASLDAVAHERAGDPGPVVLRRLSNTEYTWTIRDLTGITTLDPTREFPVDGAAGEGFTNTGMSLVMSPALVGKFLDAGKDIARHALLVPDGLRWSAGVSRRDGTDELLRAIRAFYARHTIAGEGGTVNLQGITLDRSQGAKLPLEPALRAALAVRGGAERAASAAANGVSAKYLDLLIGYLAGSDDHLDAGPRAAWRSVQAPDLPALGAAIERWQHVLWKFNPVGQVGWPKGPAHWMEPVLPLSAAQEVKVKLPEKSDGADQVLSLVAEDAGAGDQPAVVLWHEPRLVLPGRPPVPLREVGRLVDGLITRRDALVGSITRTLAAVAEAQAASAPFDTTELAGRHGVTTPVLAAWLAWLGITAGDPALAYLTEKVESAGDHAFIRGWRRGDLPSLVTNSSDTEVRIPGRVKPHGVVVHPSPQLAIAVGWRSPLSGTVRIEGVVTDAHHDCGNGVTWALERRRGAQRQRLGSGIAHNNDLGTIAPITISVRSGDLLALVIGPRGSDHTCDLTDLELTIASAAEADRPARSWSLSRELSADPLAGNPHADAAGTPAIWHIFTEPVNEAITTTTVPTGSLLARWLASDQPAEQQRLAAELQALAMAPAPKDGPDAVLRRQLTSLTGPLMGPPAAGDANGRDDSSWGVPARLFGHHPLGTALAANDLALAAPAVVSCRLPAELAANGELIATASSAGGPTSDALRVRAVSGAPAVARSDWWNGDAASPLLAPADGTARRRLTAAFADMQRVFPAAVCYTRIVPVDEVVTLTLFFREDDELKRLALSDDEIAELDRLWQQLHFISQDALTQVDAFEQIWQYTTQGGDPSALEPMRKPILERAEAFRRWQAECEPQQIDAAIAIAERAYRRPLAAPERDGLLALYRALRTQEIPHEEALRLLIARELVSPAFLYKSERPAPGTQQRPIGAPELATRLSYFLWSSQPDGILRSLADSGRLGDPTVLAEQTRRMLVDARARRLASTFGCAWLQVDGVDTLDEKSERHFPTFLALRGDLQEEAVCFLADLIQGDRSLLSVLDADHTFLNEALAKHYGIPGVTGAEWRRVDGVGKYHRGGVLGMGAALAKHAGASRTSPILRGNWISEVLLGEKLPRPPKGVPQLPEDEGAGRMTMREITERHTADVRCSGCHARIDPFGYTLESFDAIGRWRDHDLGQRPLDTRVTVPDGSVLAGVDDLRRYLLDQRRDAFVHQFCRKLLGFALGRGVQLSDEPLLAEMQARLAANGYRVTIAIESVVQSRQFREIRGRDAVVEE